jgi:hypothetical protein
MFIHANKGAVRVEQQLTGQTVVVPQSGDVSLTNGQIESLRTASGHCTCTLLTAIRPMSAGTEISQLATKEEIKKKAAEPKPLPSQESVAQTAQPEEPIYQVFMPPLQYDAKSKVQAEFDPNLIILVRRARVRPTLIFQGRVEGEPVVARSTSPASTGKSQPYIKAHSEPTSRTRINPYFRNPWFPSTLRFR